MSKKIKINVTKRDIERWVFKIRNGKTHNMYCNCAITKAIRRHKGLENLNMGSMHIYGNLKTGRFTSDMVSDAVYSSRVTIDRGIIVDPFSFILEVPDGSI